MDKLKKSLIAYTGLLMFIGMIAALVPVRAQGQPPAPVVSTRDVDNPARQPVQASAFCVAGPSGCQETIYTVPTGKRLVIEYVSFAAESGVAGAVAVWFIETMLQGGLEHHRFPVTSPPALRHPEERRGRLRRGRTATREHGEVLDRTWGESMELQVGRPRPRSDTSPVVPEQGGKS